ncbi:MAG: glycosyltransferase, partial [Gammaproteobacteria bacterium]|nr:glycosyltransferase [Gammaproteobacteria bacterium]
EIPSNKANSIQVMKVCQAFARLGHAVTLLTPATQAGEPIWQALAAHYGLTTPFELQFVPINSTMKRRDFAWKAVRKARNLGAELIYARALPPAVLGLLLGIPVILEMHQMPGGAFGPVWYRQFLQLSGRKRLVAITRALKLSLEKKYRPVLPESQVLVAPSGVDLDRFTDLPDAETARSRLNLASGWTVVCSGHLYAGRGMQLFAELAGRMPQVNFLWAGGTAQDVETWRRKMNAAGLQNVNLTGFIPNSELPLYQAAADALLIPYGRAFTNSGGENISNVSSPMKIFEYMAAGRVILCSDLPVLREVLNESNAILCPAEDAQAWEQALGALQADAGVGQLLADQARRDVEKYSWEARCRLILAGFMEGKE